MGRSLGEAHFLLEPGRWNAWTSFSNDKLQEKNSAGGINLAIRLILPKNYGALVPSIIRTLFALFREVAIVPCSCVVYIFGPFVLR